MSIIEKAVDKLGKVTEQPASSPQITDAIEQQAEADTGQTPDQTGQPLAKPVAATATPPAPHDEPSARQIQLSNQQLKQMGMIALDGERSQLAEEFRLIKRPLLMNAFGQGAAPVPNGNLIMVTSSLPGEGKTFSSINLALSIAMELDRTVLLVDADVAKPSVLRSLGIKGISGKGLLDVLRDSRLSLGDVLIKTNVENLSILPAGHTYKHATELLASDAMTTFIQEIASRYPDRIVIFDSPPLLATSEASVLASHMGQIVMVVAAESTPEDAVKEALARIEGSCDVIGMLLNKANPIVGTDYYYGYYGSYGN